MKAIVSEIQEDGSAILNVEEMTDEEKEFFVQQGIIYTMMKQALKINSDDEFFLATAKGAGVELAVDISE